MTIRPARRVARWLPIIAAALAAATSRADDLWSRLDHDRFVERLGTQGLDRVLDALDRAEPADSTIESLRRRLARARTPLLAEDRTPESVTAASLEAIALRDALLVECGESDPLRGRHLGDQVEDILLWLLPAEGADLAARFGAPTLAQRGLIERWLPLAEAMSAESLRASAAAIAAIDREAAGGSLAPLRAIERRRIAEELDPRLTFLRGLALAMSAELLVDLPDRAERRREAIALLEPRRDAAAPDLAELARLEIGVARSALREHAAAIRELEALAADAAASRRRRFEARAAIVVDEARRGDPDNAIRRLVALRRQDAADPALRAFELPWADLEHRLRVEDATRRNLPPDAAALAAIAPWTELVERLPRAERDAFVPAILARLQDAGGSLEPAPPLVLLARAEARRSAREGATPDPEATAWLEDALLRSEIGSSTRVLLLRALARASIEEARWLDAVRLLVELAAGTPEDPLAVPAIDAAVELATNLAAAESAEADSLESRRLAGDVLRTALRTFPRHPRRDAWLLASAGLATEEGRFDDAIESLSLVAADGPEARAARVQSLETATRAAEAAEGRDVARWIDRAEAWLRQLEPWPVDPPEQADAEEHRSLGVRVALARARLHLLADRPAAALVEVATIREVAALSREQAVEGVRIRLAAFDRLGRADEAAAELRRLSETGDAEAGELLSSRLEVALAAARRAEGDGDSERAARIGRESAGPLAEALLAWADGRATPPRTRQLLLVSEGLRRAGRPTPALEVVRRIDARFGSVREVVIERAECLFAAGRLEDLAEAMTLYRRIAASSEEESPAWWLAELRQLQVLRRVGRDSHRIPPRIERLRQVDGELGGEGIRREFEALLLDLRATSDAAGAPVR